MSKATDRAFNIKQEQKDIANRLKMLSPEERQAYHAKVGHNLLRHRYWYYALDKPLLSDFEYDLLERFYDELSRQLSLPPVHDKMVGFDPQAPGAMAAKESVDNEHY